MSQAHAGAVSLVRLSTAWSSKNPGIVNPAPDTVLRLAVRKASADLELISWVRE